jgi:hypothetical protein
MQSKYPVPILFISTTVTGAYFLYAFIAVANAQNCEGFSCLGNFTTGIFNNACHFSAIDNWIDYFNDYFDL